MLVFWGSRTVSVIVPWRVICFACVTTMTSVNLPWCYLTLQAPPSLHEETRLVPGRPPWTNLRDNTNHRRARRRASWNSAKIPCLSIMPEVLSKDSETIFSYTTAGGYSRLGIVVFKVLVELYEVVSEHTEIASLYIVDGNDDGLCT
jgi:hypothetical protein